jgi:hypothetical protein
VTAPTTNFPNLGTTSNDGLLTWLRDLRDHLAVVEEDLRKQMAEAKKEAGDAAL